jgi:hypothetical protein
MGRFRNIIQNFCAVLIGVLALSAEAQRVPAEPLLIIVRFDSPVNALSRQEVADLYLDRSGVREKWGVPLKPLDQQDDTLRERFYGEVAAMSLNRLRAYWSKRVFTGRGRPPEEHPPERAAQVVAQDPKVVVYVPAGQCPKGVKVVHTIP